MISVESYFHPECKIDRDMVDKLERLSRQTSLAALETILDMGEESRSLTRSTPKNSLMAKAVATHIIRAGMEMQQTISQLS